MKRLFFVFVALLSLTGPFACVVQTDTLAGSPGEDGAPGVSPFSKSANGDIYYIEGRVGIGTAEPESLFHVHHDGDPTSTTSDYLGNGYVTVEAFARSNATNYNPFNTSPSAVLSVVGGENDLNKAATMALSQFNAVSTITSLYTATSRSSLSFATSRGETEYDHGIPVEAMRISDTGHVGIGTTAPVETLDVAGYLGLRDPTGAGARINLHGNVGASGANAGFSSTIYMYEQSATTVNHEVALVKAGLWDDPTTEEADVSIGSLELSTKTADAWVSGIYLRDGTIGINTTSPGCTLDVNGTARLAKYATPPFPCDTDHDGVIAMTVAYYTCVCNGTTSHWVKTSDGSSACSNWP